MNNNFLNKSALVLVTLSLFSCSSSIYPLSVSEINGDTVITSVSNKPGATLSVKIDFNQPGFQTKDNSNGVAKIPMITKYYVYLVKNNNTTAYPLNGDPIADAVVGPLLVTSNSNISRLIVFNDVPDSGAGAYYAAVRAQDSVNTDLIVANDGRTAPGQLWTVTTAGAPYNGKVSVSSGAGITVNSSYVVSSPTALTVTPNIESAGATLEANISPNGGNNLPLSVIPNFMISRIAGTGAFGSVSVADSIATNTKLNAPYGVAVDSSGNVYIANTNNYRISKVTPDGRMSTIAGTGIDGQAPVADSVATNTPLSEPSGVAVDSSGNIYIANSLNHTVRKVTPAGMMSTIAGTGTAGVTPLTDNVATSTPLNYPNGVAVDSSGNVYIANYNNHTINKVTPGGTISTIAGNGTGGNASVTGSLVATSAPLNQPTGVAVDSSGNVYIGNTSNYTIRKVTPGGMMSTIAGRGSGGVTSLTESIATNIFLNFPTGVAVDSSGNVYFANSGSHTINKITPEGIMSTVAGTGINGVSPVTESVATNTQLNDPKGVALDSFGNVYIANTFDSTIMKVF